MTDPKRFLLSSNLQIEIVLKVPYFKKRLFKNSELHRHSLHSCDTFVVSDSLHKFHSLKHVTNFQQTDLLSFCFRLEANFL